MLFKFVKNGSKHTFYGSWSRSLQKKTGAGQEQTGSATLLIGFRTKLCLIIFWYRYGEVARSEAKCTGTGIQQL